MRLATTNSEKAIAVIEMSVEDGATAAGELPVDHARAIIDANDNKRVREIRDSHRRGEPPAQRGGPE